MKFQVQKSIRSFFLIFIKFLIILLLLVDVLMKPIYTKEKLSEDNRCYMDALSLDMTTKNISSIEDGGLIPLKDVLLAEEKPAPGKSIFFLETSCPCSDPLHKWLTLTPRQACAVESAALHNPNLEIFVLFACPTFHHQFDPILDAILNYTNVKLRHVNLWSLAAGTPVEDWVKTEDLFRSRYLLNNLSNLLRLLILYRFGGIYIDMDVVILRSFENEPLNFVGAEFHKFISNAVIGLKPDGFGHKLGELFLRDFQENYNGDIWAHNGPKSLQRVLTPFCKTNNVIYKDHDRCMGIKVYHKNAFFEISFGEWTHFFEPKFAKDTLKRLKDSHLTHLWNRMSRKRSLQIDSKAAYIYLARQNCPRVLAAKKYYFD